MGSQRAKQLRRERRRIERRRAAHAAEAHRTQDLQAQADARRNLARQHRRHALAWALWIAAAVIAIGHFFEHADTVRFMSQGLEDLLIGWPMAGVLALVGGIVYGT